jgi:hypothetical protein
MKWIRLLAILSVVSLGSLATAACDDDDDNGTEPTPTAPSAPTGVTASANGTTVTVSWNAVGNADSYRVVLSAPGENDRTETTSSTSVDFSGLTAGTTYAAQVFAVNTAGETGSALATVLVDEEEPGFVEVNADILENTTWTSDKVWILTQPIFVGRDCGPDGNDPDCVQATLTIEPGTTILGRFDLPQGVRGAYLVVSRGSRIVADATGEDRPPTADEVIVFTSDRPRGERDRGDWGGVIINGRAQVNAGVEAQGEGDSGFYGGNDDQDDSGIFRGVRIEFAGDRVTPADELNGLALQGVGAGTTVSYVQIHYNVDDGIEPYGGTVSVDHLVVTGIGDDSVDGTDGYRGFMQFIVGQQRGDEADNGMELSNDGEDADVTPRSTAVIANATMIGGDSDLQSGEIGGPNGDRGIELRESTHYRVYNSIVVDFGDAGVCVGEGQAVVNANNRLAAIGGTYDPQTMLDVQGSIFWNNAGPGDSVENFEACGGYTTEENQTLFLDPALNNLLADPLLDPSYNIVGEQSAPPAIIATAVPEGYTPFDLDALQYDGVNLFAPTDGRRLVTTSYPGAVEPGTDVADAWYAGWTVWTPNGSDSRPNQDGN